MTDSSGTPRTDALDLECQGSTDTLSIAKKFRVLARQLESELKSTKGRMWENGHALERELAALRSEGERYREALSGLRRAIRKAADHGYLCPTSTPSKCIHGVQNAGRGSGNHNPCPDCWSLIHGDAAALSSAPPSDSAAAPDADTPIEEANTLSSESLNSQCAADVEALSDAVMHIVGPELHRLVWEEFEAQRKLAPRAALRSSVRVPREPTEAMREACNRELDSPNGYSAWSIWRAMLAAAPATPSDGRYREALRKYVVVPREATREMRSAAWKKLLKGAGGEDGYKQMAIAWREMIAAAPDADTREGP